MNQPYPQQQQYGQAQAPVIGVGEWVVTYIVLALPIVGLIMAFVWGFGSGTNPNKANFCKAYLIFIAIAVALYVLLIVFIVGAGAAAGGYN